LDVVKKLKIINRKTPPIHFPYCVVVKVYDVRESSSERKRKGKNISVLHEKGGRVGMM